MKVFNVLGDSVEEVANGIERIKQNLKRDRSGGGKWMKCYLFYHDKCPSLLLLVLKKSKVDTGRFCYLYIKISALRFVGLRELC